MATVDNIKTFQRGLRQLRDEQQRLQGKMDDLMERVKQEYNVSTEEEIKELLQETIGYREDQQAKYDRIMKEIGILYDAITG